jgi:hypothetical protein
MSRVAIERYHHVYRTNADKNGIVFIKIGLSTSEKRPRTYDLCDRIVMDKKCKSVVEAIEYINNFLKRRSVAK